MSRRSRRSKNSFIKNLSKVRIKNSTRVSLTVLFLVIFAISSANLYNSLFNSSITKVEYNIYTYTNTYNSDYNVNIKTNPFIENKSLSSGQTYISELIDSIDMNMNYKYTASKLSSLNYSYKIDAIISANYTDNGTDYNVWNKTYNLKNVDSMQSDNIININEDVSIDYSQYNKEVKSFKQSLGMNVNAYLYIKLTVNTSTTINNQEIKNEYISNFSISLGNKIAVVENKANDTKVDSVKQEETTQQININIFKVLINLILMLFSLYILYFIRYRTKKFNTIKNEFKLELNRILKSCQDRIVIVKNNLDTDDETIIDVNDFGELIKLSEELYKPILCWISDDFNNEQAYFSIISNKVKYRYILKK